jgi:4-hydroxy-tetrahydrodipicolinate synthase
VTPFKEDFSVDTEALCRIVNFSVDGGIEYLVILGTTAEMQHFLRKELKLVIRFVECNNGRLPLVLGVAVTIQ